MDTRSGMRVRSLSIMTVETFEAVMRAAFDDDNDDDVVM